MFEFLLEIDREILILVNTGWANKILDPLMAALSSRILYAIIITFFLIWAFYNKKSNSLKFFFLALLGIILSDAIAYHIIKPYFDRLRPCKEYSFIRTVEYMGCGGTYSFPSNHATNSMVLAVFGWLTFSRKVGLPLVLFAFFIGLSRVYLGVHYPADIIAGFTFGGSFALLWYVLVKAIESKFLRKAK